MVSSTRTDPTLMDEPPERRRLRMELARHEEQMAEWQVKRFEASFAIRQHRHEIVRLTRLLSQPDSQPPSEP